MMPELIQKHAVARRLMSALLCEPERQMLIDEHAARHLDETLSGLGIQLEQDDALERLLADAPADALLVEYTQLFVGPGELPDPPYGSGHIEPGRMIMGRSTLDVEAFYGEDGLAVGAGVHDLPDHVVIELEYSAHLLEQALAAVEMRERLRILDRQNEFEERFLRPWVNSFADRLERLSRLGFYRVLAQRIKLLFALPVPTRSTPAGANIAADSA